MTARHPPRSSPPLIRFSSTLLPPLILLHIRFSSPQYFLPFGLNRLNNMIERAILLADSKGVKVFTLGALNKVRAGLINESGAVSVPSSQKGINRSLGHLHIAHVPLVICALHAICSCPQLV